MNRNSSRDQIQVRCSMDEPIQLLIDKLSTKSSELYIFWQNYDHLYRQYNEKLNENNRLKEELQYVKKNPVKVVSETRHQYDEGYYKQRLRTAENNSQTFKAENQKLKQSYKDTRIQLTKITEEWNSSLNLISLLKKQNEAQSSKISIILDKLKVAQNQLNTYRKSYDLLQEKQAVLNAMIEKQKQLQLQLDEKDDEIEEMTKSNRQTKVKYERILKETMERAKKNVLNMLSPDEAMRIDRGWEAY